MKPKARGGEGQQVEGGHPSPQLCPDSSLVCLPSIPSLGKEMSCYPAVCPSALSSALRTGAAERWEEGSGAGGRRGGWQQQGCLSAASGCAEAMCGQWGELGRRCGREGETVQPCPSGNREGWKDTRNTSTALMVLGGKGPCGQRAPEGRGSQLRGLRLLVLGGCSPETLSAVGLLCEHSLVSAG